MTMKERLIAVGAEKLADILITLCGKHKDFLKELNMIMAGLDDNPKQIQTFIRKEISAFKRTTKFISWKESTPISMRLENVRKCIANDLFSKSPESAFELMLEFMNLSDQTLERLDVSSNSIGQVFTSSCEDLGRISEKVSLPQSELVEIVFTKHMKNGYCMYDGIIGHFANSLKKEGLLMLKSKFEHCLSDNQWRKSSAQEGLKEVADNLKDVDAYISACSIIPEVLQRQIPGIARRLIDHGRGQDAVNWLDRDKDNTHPDYCRLRVEALKSIGELNRAQEERLIWFDKNLSADAYREIMNASSSDFAASFKVEAMEKALTCPVPQKSLLFLKDIQELKVLGKFIRSRHKLIDGQDYILLKPIAELLENSDPLAATLIYRCMINFILVHTKNTQYKHAAKDIVKCSSLSGKVTDWESFEDHSEYFEFLQKQHKSKRRFWSDYEDVTTQSTSSAKKRKI